MSRLDVDKMPRGCVACYYRSGHDTTISMKSKEIVEFTVPNDIVEVVVTLDGEDRRFVGKRYRDNEIYLSGNGNGSHTLIGKEWEELKNLDPTPPKKWIFLPLKELFVQPKHLIIEKPWVKPVELPRTEAGQRTLMITGDNMKVNEVYI